jgi:hypothetical protein
MAPIIRKNHPGTPTSKTPDSVIELDDRARLALIRLT